MKKELERLRAYRLLEPGALCLVTVRYRDKVNTMPAAWTAPVSYHPPRVGIAIAPSHLTHDLIRRSEAFALNFPGRPLAEAVHRAGQLSGNDVDNKIEALGLTEADPDAIDAPLIEECLAHIECGLIEAIELGDHTWFVGEILAAKAEEAAFDETWLLPEDEELKPLLHLGGDLYTLPSEPIRIGLAAEEGEP